MQPVRVPLVPMSIPFLTLPREVRDIIYRHLLSTKYTKHMSTVSTIVGAVVFQQDLETDSYARAR